MAGPLRKKKFGTFFKKILLPFKYKNYFTLDLSKYGNIMLKFVGR